MDKYPIDGFGKIQQFISSESNRGEALNLVKRLFIRPKLAVALMLYNPEPIQPGMSESPISHDEANTSQEPQNQSQPPTNGQHQAERIPRNTLA